MSPAAIRPMGLAARAVVLGALLLAATAGPARAQEAAPARDGTGDTAGAAPGGASARGAAPAGVAARDAGCRVEGDDLTPADERLARSACEAARGRFHELLGDAPGVAVVVDVRDGYRIGILHGLAVVLWPSSDAIRRRVSGDDASVEAHIGTQWRDVLRHEIAHAMTAAHFFPDGRFESTGYGTPLPDWFEEGLAIWAEPRSSREARVAAARRLPAERLELGHIVAMRHPAAGNAAALAVRDGAAPPDDAALWDFYQQAAAVLTFVHDRGGSDAVRELAARLGADPGDRRALVGLPGMPSSWPAVEDAWARWISGAVD